MRLKDKVAIITGGSRGIGYAAADKFLKEGAAVIVTASTQGSADRAVTKLKEKYPDAIVDGISPDLASLESVRKAFKEVTGKYGCVDILVNNAGISESTPFMEYTEETYDKVMDLNVKGVLRLPVQQQNAWWQEVRVSFFPLPPWSVFPDSQADLPIRHQNLQ